MRKVKAHSNKVLLTGATGFTGSYVLRRLLEAGWSVDILVRPTSSMDLIQDVTPKIGIHLYTGSTEETMRIVSSVAPDVVVHLASMVVGEHKPADVTGIIESNILLGTQLLEAMARAGIKNFVNTGTYWEHFEGRDYSPVELYAASKFAFQNILQYYVELQGVNAITLKLFDAYGPLDPRSKLMNLLLRVSKTKERIQMTAGDQKIDLIHVSDVASAYVVAAERLCSNLVKGHEIYGVSSGSRLSVKEVVEKFEKVSGEKLEIEWGKRPYRKREVMDPCQLERLPGWTPQITLVEGIASLLMSDGGAERE